MCQSQTPSCILQILLLPCSQKEGTSPDISIYGQDLQVVRMLGVRLHEDTGQ